MRMLALCAASLCIAGVAAADPARDMDALLARHYPADAPGAAVIVVKDGKPLLRKGYGLANVELGVAMRPELVFRLASITKQFTAVAILLLVHDGKVALGDDITRFLPGYPTHGQHITVEQLLTHTSGIQSYTDMESWATPNVWRRDFTVAQMIDLFKNQPMRSKPGERWEYNNSGYTLLGAIIEKAAGMSYGDFIRQRIFTPLGMKHSYYGETAPIIPGRVAGYQRDARGFVNAEYLSMTQPYAAGSLLSTVDDLARWDAALYTEQLLPQALLQKAWTRSHLNSGEANGYGYGWNLWSFDGHRVVEHTGGIFGFSNDALRLPDDHVYVAVLSNSQNGPPTAELALRLAALALGRSIHDPAQVTLPAASLDRLAGRYQLPDKGVVTVEHVGDHLLITGPHDDKHHAFPQSESEFFEKGSLGRIRFERDVRGGGSALEVLDHRGNGDRALRQPKP